MVASLCFRRHSMDLARCHVDNVRCVSAEVSESNLYTTHQHHAINERVVLNCVIFTSSDKPQLCYFHEIWKSKLLQQQNTSGTTQCYNHTWNQGHWTSFSLQSPYRVTGWPLSRQCEIPWQFHDSSLTVRGTPAHVKCYSYHVGTSVIVSDGGRNATVHDPKPKRNAQTQHLKLRMDAWHFTHSCQIPRHFQAFHTSGHPVHKPRLGLGGKMVPTDLLVARPGFTLWAFHEIRTERISRCSRERQKWKENENYDYLKQD